MDRDRKNERLGRPRMPVGFPTKEFWNFGSLENPGSRRLSVQPSFAHVSWNFRQQNGKFIVCTITEIDFALGLPTANQNQLRAPPLSAPLITASIALIFYSKFFCVEHHICYVKYWYSGIGALFYLYHYFLSRDPTPNCRFHRAYCTVGTATKEVQFLGILSYQPDKNNLTTPLDCQRCGERIKTQSYVVPSSSSSSSRLWLL